MSQQSVWADGRLLSPTLPFELPEYHQRLARVHQRMDAAGVDVLVLTDPANICYLSGYDAWSFYVHQCLLLARDAPAPHWLGRACDANGARLTCWIPPENVLAYPEHCVESTTDHPMRYVADHVAAMGHATGRIGVEMDSWYCTARSQRILEDVLDAARFVDATGLVNMVRLVKSDREIELMRQAARIVERAMQVAVDTIAPGVRQNDVVAAISHAQISGTEEYGGDYTAIVPMLPMGHYSSAPHITWSDRRFSADEGTIVEIAGCRLRYHCPLARTVFLGTPPAHVRNVESAVVEGAAAALEAVRPGALCEDVEQAWRDTVSRHGVVKESRLGYSIGLGYPPGWGETSANLRPGDRTPLVTNMTFHLMAGIWFADWGIEISQPFRVSEDGCEPLTTFPRELVVKA